MPYPLDKEPIPEPEWTDEMKARKRGATTLQTCGWCKYTTGGVYLHDCSLHAGCALLTPNAPYNRDLYWNTPCVLRALGESDIQCIVDHKRHVVDDYLREIDATLDQILVLQHQQRETPERPLLASNRSTDYFTVGDEVVCALTDNNWYSGRVVDGYRHHDGIVTFETMRGVYSCGFRSPTILKMIEYEYFMVHPDEFTRWVQLSSSNDISDALQMKPVQEPQA